MTLKPSQILAQLHAKQADFQAFDATALGVLQLYRQALTKFSQSSATELMNWLTGIDHPGAVPLEPLAQSVQWIIPSQLQWQHREQSLAWVRDRLLGISTFAVDGSQIYPSKDFSIPVALVQIGWFENAHLPGGIYEKDTQLEVMTPAELSANSSAEPVDRRVSMRRFQMETQRLIQYMQEHPQCETCLVFLDGALVATFAEAFDQDTRDFYVRCLLKLLRASQQYQVPLVGYIDTTYAGDLTRMLQILGELPDSQTIHDAQLLNPFMNWGDRTPLFRCQRAGILSHYQEQRQRIGFTYLKTNDNFPARLEFPLWVYESGNLDRVIDWVRGEVIIGSGYPYSLETADQTAVLQSSDRQTFYRIFQDWAEQTDLQLRLSRKMVSKVRRR